MPIYLTPIDAQLKEDEVYSGKVELLKIKIKMIKNKQLIKPYLYVMLLKAKIFVFLVLIKLFVIIDKNVGIVA